MTVAELADRFAERTHDRDGHAISPRTRASLASFRWRLVEACGAAFSPERVTREHVEAALAFPVRHAWGPARQPNDVSRRTWLRWLRALFRDAVARGWIDHDPTVGVCADVRRERMQPWLREAEVPRVLDACTDVWRARFTVLVETGMRLTEALSARWEWVHAGDIGRPMLLVPEADDGFAAKGREARSVGLSLVAQAALDDAARLWGRDGYLLHDHAAPPEASAWRRELSEACKAAGVRHVGPHGLRRTAGALWLRAGIDIYRVSRMLGHSSVTVTEHWYAGLHDDAMSTAMDLVDARRELPSTERERAKRRKRGEE